MWCLSLLRTEHARIKPMSHDVGTNVNEPVSGYITESTNDWTMTGMVPMKFNRMVLYLQNVWHTAYVKPGMFTNDVYRLNQQFFI